MLGKTLGFLICCLGLLSCRINDSASVMSSEAASADLQTLAQRFAPLLSLHPQEQFFPMDPSEFFPLIDLDKQPSVFTDPREAFLSGARPRTLVQISADRTQLQYWFFYAKNGCQGFRFEYRLTGAIKIGELAQKLSQLELCNLAQHEGDWEHITLRLDPSLNRVVSAFYSAHQGGNWLPASALEFSGDRPLAYVALNSHAIYPRASNFHAEVTIQHAALNALLGIEWLQVGDVVSGRASVNRDPSGGVGPIFWATGEALMLWDDVRNEALAAYGGRWGQTMKATEVTSPPDVPGQMGPVLKVGAQLAAATILKNEDAGQAPESPWGRREWLEFDRNPEQPQVGYVYGDLWGGDQGRAFDDGEHLPRLASPTIKSIALHSGKRLDRVCLTWTDGSVQCHGGDGGTERSLTLDPGETIQSFTVAQGKHKGGLLQTDHQRVFALRIVTSHNRSIEGGTWTDQRAVYTAPEGMQIAGWYGRSGDEIDALGAIFATL